LLIKQFEKSFSKIFWNKVKNFGFYSPKNLYNIIFVDWVSSWKPRRYNQKVEKLQKTVPQIKKCDKIKQTAKQLEYQYW